MIVVSLALAPVACEGDGEQSVHRAGSEVDSFVDFEPPVLFGPQGLASVDAGLIDDDDLPDVVAFGGGAMRWFDAGAGWAQHEFDVPVERPFKGAVRVADMDGDGDDDVIAAMDNHSNAPKSAYIYVLENPGGAAVGGWTTHTALSNAPVHHVNDMEIADMDGDGRKDVVVRSLDPNQVHILFQNNLDSWQQKTIDTAVFHPDGEGLAVGDIDGIGHPDISVSGYWLHAPANPRTGSYGSHVIDDGVNAGTSNHNTKEALGDLDGDGDLDILISPAEGYRAGQNDELAVYWNPGTPRSSGPWPRTVLRNNFNGGHFAKLGDLDNDGDLDVVSGVAWPKWGQAATLRAFFNLGGGAFSEPQTIDGTRGMYSGAVVDLGNDGDLDIVGCHKYKGRVHIYESMAFEDLDSADPPEDGGSATMDDDGSDVSPLLVEAEDFASADGVGVYAANPGEKIGAIDDGEWVRFDDVFIDEEHSIVEARISAKHRREGRIEFRRGDVAGELLATIEVPQTGSWDEFVVRSAVLSGTNGGDDLYLVFRGDAAKKTNVVDVDSFEFR